MLELSISKVLDFLIAILLIKDSFTCSFQGFANFQEKDFKRIFLSGCFRCFQGAILT